MKMHYLLPFILACFINFSAQNMILAIEQPMLTEGDRSDITMKDGTVYENVRISFIGLDHIIIIGSEGIATLASASLAEETLARFSFDPEQGRKHRENRENRERDRIRSDREQREQARIREWWAVFVQEHAIDAVVKIFQLSSDGILATGYGYMSDRRVFESNDEHSRTAFGVDFVRKQTTTRYERPLVEFRELKDRIFILCDVADLRENQVAKSRIWPVGTYEYQTVGGANASIPKYTVSESEFISFARRNGHGPLN